VKYDYQLILRLNSDLQSMCDSLWDKRQEKQDGYTSVGDDVIYHSATTNIPDGQFGWTSAEPETSLTAQSRIVVVGHGEPTSTRIGVYNGAGFTVDQAADLIRSFIPAKVKIARLSLLCCFAGGNRFGKDLQGIVNAKPVVPSEGSFALRLYIALRGCVASVSARNTEVGHGEPIVGGGHKTVTWNANDVQGSKQTGAKLVLHSMNQAGNAWSERIPY
jgi:hypothetical protein